MKLLNKFFACSIAALMCFTSSCNSQKSNIILETEHLYFCSFEESDFEQLYELFSDKEVMEHIPMEKAMGKKMDRAAIKEMLDSFIQHQREHGYSFWAAFEKGTNEFVGRIGMHKYQEPNTVMAGYILRKRFWGKGYATESMRGIINWTFSHTDINKIIAVTVSEHKASIHVIEKVGMHYAKEYQEYGCTFVQYAIERPTNYWHQFKNWFKRKFFMQKTNVFLNHVYAMIDEETYQEIKKSDFLKNEFCKSQERTNASKEGSWTGFYMTGESTYIELFNNKNKKTLQEIEIARIGIGFSVDRKEEFENLINTLNQNFATDIKHSLCEKKIGNNLVPWFYVIEFKDDVTAKLELVSWIMAYRSDYLKLKSIKASTKNSVTRKEYNSDLFDENKLFKDIEEITLLLNEEVKKSFIKKQVLLGYSCEETTDYTICYGPEITFKLKTSNNETCKLLQLKMSLNRNVNDLQLHKLGNSTIELENKTATWTFR